MKKSILILSVFLLGCISKKNNLETQHNHVSKHTIKEKESVVFPNTPHNISFANVQYTFDDHDLKERLERELIVNTFWHSNTMFYIKRANRWFPLIESILEEEGIPEDFKYLAVIESGLKQAKSPAGALGFWQFMKGTAKDYGLEISRTVDERMHVEKSTRAACQYLKDAYDKFDSWALAAAAYNRGVNGISSDLTKQEVEHLFDLHLNSETARYFFRILAVKEILENPTKYNFNVTNDQLYDSYKTKKLTVNSDIKDLSSWSKTKGFNLKIIKKLNPWLISNSLKVEKGKSYVILLPTNDEKLKPYAVK